MAWARAVSIAVLPLAAGLLAVDATAVLLGLDGAAARWLVLSIAFALPPLVLGQAITGRFPAQAVGALLCCAGLATLAVGTNDTWMAAAQLHPGLPLSGLLVSLAQGSWMLLYLPWALMLLLFPAGRFGSRATRNLARGLCAVTAAFTVLAGLGPGPYASGFQQQHRAMAPVQGADIAAAALLPVFLVLLLASAYGLLERFRAADPATRTQIRWLAVAGAIVPAALLLCWAGYLMGGRQWPVLLGLAAMNLLIPAAIAVGILRSDLLDAGRVLVALLGLTVMCGLVMALTLLLLRWPGVGSPAAAVLSLVGVAAGTLFLAGLRPRILRAIGRIFHAEHERLMDALSMFQRQVLADAARPTDLEAVLRTATGDLSLRLGYATSGGSTYLDASGHRIEAGGGVPVDLAGRRIGVVLPSPGHRAVFNTHVTRALALPLEMGRQQLELATALAETDASRIRILLAAHHERKRLERDLHDGAQQRLVALGMALRLIQRQLPPREQALRGMLDESVAELGTAVAELRQIAHGIRPSALDEGLEVALRQLSGRSPTPVQLRIGDSLGMVPELVGATAYFVAAEAVHNAVKHAGARRITVRLGREGESVRLSVSDDGRGGAMRTPGGGLAGLADRVGALGGSMNIHSQVGRGTVIEAVLPCA